MCRLKTPEDLNDFLSLCLPKNAPGPLCSAAASSQDVPEQLGGAALGLRRVQCGGTLGKGNPESGRKKSVEILFTESKPRRRAAKPQLAT